MRGNKEKYRNKINCQLTVNQICVISFSLLIVHSLYSLGDWDKRSHHPNN